MHHQDSKFPDVMSVDYGGPHFRSECETQSTGFDPGDAKHDGVGPTERFWEGSLTWGIMYLRQEPWGEPRLPPHPKGVIDDIPSAVQFPPQNKSCGVLHSCQCTQLEPGKQGNKNYSVK